MSRWRSATAPADVDELVAAMAAAVVQPRAGLVVAESLVAVPVEAVDVPGAVGWTAAPADVDELAVGLAAALVQ